MSFKNLGLIEPILKALEAEGYTQPTPIQSQSIPLLLAGKDLLACAQTGTGKTAAFALPIIQQLATQNLQDQRKIKALIVTPTRELAIQIDESFDVYGKNTKIRHAVIFGGVVQGKQVNALRSGVDVLVAKPGRLLDLIQQGFINLSHIQYFVLDEADRMLDMGFIHDVKRIIKILPVKRQSLFFSATMPPSIKALADTILFQPAQVEVTPVSSTAETIQQEIYHVDQVNKYDLLKHVLQDKNIISALVFTRTKHGADKVVKILNRSNITAEAIHGNKSQNARQKALSNFKNKTTRVLVATDIAARGIDIDELAFVVNFEIPNIPETYVHRIGRTGRAGASGKAVSFCDVEERAFLRDIQKLINIQIPVTEAHPYPAGDGVTHVPLVRSGQKQQSPSSHHGSGKNKGNSPRKPYFQGKGTAPKQQKRTFRAAQS